MSGLLRKKENTGLGNSVQCTLFLHRLCSWQLREVKVLA